jgi:C_GCAxxG_C_C family probable redox protein
MGRELFFISAPLLREKRGGLEMSDQMSDQPDLRQEVSDYAAENFKSGLNCAECVLDALIRSGALKVPLETRAMAIGFGGGIGLSGFTCGALSAAVMANGAVYGRPDPWKVAPEVRGLEISEKYYRRYNKMVWDFHAMNEGVLCKDICGKYEDWHSRDRRKMCMRLIANAAAMAYDYLQMSQEEAFALPYGENMGGTK